jgi:hypothetical protein
MMITKTLPLIAREGLTTGIRKRIVGIPTFGSMMKALEQGFATTKGADSHHDDWSGYLVRPHHYPQKKGFTILPGRNTMIYDD